MKIIKKKIFIILAVLIIGILLLSMLYRNTLTMGVSDHVTIVKSEPIPNSSSTFDDKADEIVKKFKTANIAYNAPALMKKNKPQIIHLVISRNEKIEDIKIVIKEFGEKIGKSIKLSSNVKAHLVGSGFQISAITPEEQLITSSQRTNWKWEVVPIKAGHLRLHLSISAIIKYDGERTNRYINSYDQDIYVEVNTISKVSEFLSKNWKWILGSIIIPLLGIYLYRKDIVIQVDDNTEINIGKQREKKEFNGNEERNGKSKIILSEDITIEKPVDSNKKIKKDIRIEDPDKYTASKGGANSKKE